MKDSRRNALIFIISLVVALALAEVALRLAGITYPLFYRPDPYLGGSLRPGTKGYWIKEGCGYVSINSDGLRDREHSIKKPADTFRIAVLGDSYAEALQVDREQTFWAVMEKELGTCSALKGKTVEVINFGKAGMGTTEELIILRRRAWKYSPDLVLLAFLTGNDVSDNSRALKGIDYNPYYVYKDNRLVLDDRGPRESYERKAWRDPIMAYMINSSRVLQVIYEATVRARLRWRARRRSGSTGAQAGSSHEAGLNPTVYREPTDREWKEAWRVTEGVLSMMAEEVKGKGVKFLVVILSNPVQVHPDPHVRRQMEQELHVKDLFYPDRRVASRCSSLGIPVLALAPLLRSYAEKNKVFLHGFAPKSGGGHWNRLGHGIAGRKIAEWICTQIQGK